MNYHGHILVHGDMFDELTMTMKSFPIEVQFWIPCQKGKHNQDRRDINVNTKLRHDPVKLVEEYITITGSTWMVICIAVCRFIAQTIRLMGDMYIHNHGPTVCPVF